MRLDIYISKIKLFSLTSIIIYLILLFVLYMKLLKEFYYL